MKIYLDTCSLQRPLDSRNQVRIIVEAEAILGILSLFESGRIDADYFCTCDVSFFRKAKSIPGLKTKVVSPIELIEEVESWQ